MKILLVQNMIYVPTHGGASKANRLLLEGLAAKGHSCRVVVPAFGMQVSVKTQAQFLSELDARGISLTSTSSTVAVFQYNGVEVHAVTDISRLHDYVAGQIREFEPTWSLVSDDDPGQLMLEAALEASPARVVYLVHTPQSLPFGPKGFLRNRAKADLVRQTAGIVTVSNHIKDYIKQWSGLDSVALAFPVYGSGPFPNLGCFDNGFVTLINPCAVKGISIFLELARRMPEVQFAGVPTWGTTSADRVAMGRLPNIRLLPPVDNIDEIFRQTRVLLMPSLWTENFPLTVTEAMLRGIPVIGSNSGGLPETKREVDYVIPVRLIEQYEDRFDELGNPVPIVPDQDVDPWEETLRKLLSDRALYEQLSAASREAALRFVSSVRVEPFENYLENLQPASQVKQGDTSTLAKQQGAETSNLHSSLSNLSPERLELLARRLKKKGKDSSQINRTILRRVEINSVPPSFAQERLWFLDQWEPGSSGYNNSDAFRLTGRLNQEALERSLNEIISRHETLRTVFAVVDGRPVQVIAPTLTTTLSISDLRELPEREARARRLATEEAQRPFDLARGPLLRTRLLRLGEEDHVLLLTMHHIVSDGWSAGVLFRELGVLYEAFVAGRPSPLEELPIQYADYAVWQREWLRGEVLERQLSYWKEQLGGSLPVLELPTDRPRPAVQSYQGASQPVVLSKGVSERLKALSQQEGATLFMTLLTAFQTLLMRYTGQADIVVGSAIAGRNRAETEALIGCFVNTLVLRTDLSGNPTFRESLSNVRKVALGAYEHQDLPFEKLVEELQPERSLSRNPLFQVMFIFENASGSSLELPGLSLSPMSFDRRAVRSDLDLYLWEASGELHGHFVYSTDLFDAATIARMSERLQVLAESIVRDPDAVLADLQLNKEFKLPSLPQVANQQAKVPLSYHQERLWFIDQFETGNVYESGPVYHNIPLILHLSGRVDSGVLESSLNAVINRHAALRTRIITENGQGLQLVSDHESLKLKVVELADDAERSSLDQVVARALEEARQPFVLERDLPIRAALFQMKGDESVLAVTIHHIIADKKSLHLIVEELAEVYDAQLAGCAAQLPELALQHADYTEWQRSLPKDAIEPLLFYWKWQLRGKLPALELPEDRPRPAVHTYTAARDTFKLGEQLTRGLKALSEEEGSNTFAVVLAAFKVLLHRYARQDEIVVGTGESGRVQPGTEKVVGSFANLVVLRSRLAGNPSFRTFLAELTKTVEQARAHAEMPFDMLVQELNPEKDMSRTALFDVLFQYEEREPPTLELGDVKARVIDTNLGYGKYDINLSIQGGAGGLSGTVVYNADIYDRAMIERMMRHFEVMLDAMAADPGQRVDDVKLLSKDEERQQLVAWNSTQASYPEEKTIHQLFEEQARRSPGNTAVVFGDTRLTYREVDERANQLAHHLRNQGVKADTLVAMCLNKSAEMIVALLGVLKAGGAYLPMDPAYPEDRLRFMMEDSGVSHLITTQALLDSVPVKVKSVILLDADGEGICTQETTTPSPSAGADNLAYCIYTSGSTGKPKGVLLEHRHVVRLLVNDKLPFSFTETDVWTMFHSYCFDFSVWEMYGALLYGGKLVVVAEPVMKDPSLFLGLLLGERVTVLNQTPTAFDNVMGQALERQAGLALRYVIFGGEALHPAQLREWKKAYPAVKLINMYGITETTVHVTFKEITDAEIEENVSNIGRPIPTTTTYIMDADLRLLPVGVIGEVCVGGVGVGRGYLGRDELTRQKFVLNPYKAEERLYRSGDLAKLLSSGEMIYLGRIDDQVQIRGFRVELGEVKSQLLKHPAVAKAEVIARKLLTDALELVAYVVPAAEVSVTALRNHLAQALPYYMVPSAFVMLKALPMTPNGKVDRRALPEPDGARPEVETIFVAPRTAVEESLAKIWTEVLGVERVGINDNFFELGGHSLLATQAISRVRQALHVELPLRSFFEGPTIARLSESIEKAQGNGTELRVPAIIPVSRQAHRVKVSSEGVLGVPEV